MTSSTEFILSYYNAELGWFDGMGIWWKPNSLNIPELYRCYYNSIHNIAGSIH